MLPQVSAERAMSGPAAPDACGVLAQIRAEIDTLQLQLADARSRRDDEIQRVNREFSVSERVAADAAGVSPGYAHRAVVHGRFARVLR